MHAEPAIDVILLDVMVGFQNPGDKEPEPIEIETEGYLRAGIRVLKMIRQVASYSDVPILLYSNVPNDDIKAAVRQAELDPAAVTIVSKGENGENLAAAIRAVMHAPKGLAKTL